MSEMLTVEYAGQLATDPSMQYTSKGTAVTNFSVAYNNKRGDKDEVTWIRCVVWGKKAEAVNQWLKKGSKIFFRGALKPDPETGGPRIWFDSDGEPRASFEVNVFEIVFISDLSDGGSHRDPSEIEGAQQVEESSFSNQEFD